MSRHLSHRHLPVAAGIGALLLAGVLLGQWLAGPYLEQL